MVDVEIDRDSSEGKLGDITLIYQTYMDSIKTAELRRSQINTIYASLVTATLASLGVLEQVNPAFPAIAILFLSSLWISQIEFFKTLASLKWKTALALEKRLIEAPFTREYETIKLARAGKNHSRARFSDLEIRMPRLLQIASGLYLLYLGFDHLGYIDLLF